MRTNRRVGIAIRRGMPEIGIIARGKMIFSTFSFKGKVRERLKEAVEKGGWEHEPGRDGHAGEVLERALGGEDVFDWSLLSSAQEKLLRELRGVKEPVTYGELAHRCGTSPRAVGAIMRSNPFAYFVPCHLVVGKNGLGGFSIGADEKRLLLEHQSFSACVGSSSDLSRTSR